MPELGQNPNATRVPLCLLPPEPDSCSGVQQKRSLDYLHGESKQRRRNVHGERLRRLQVSLEIDLYFQAASTKLKSKNFDAGGTGWLRSPH
jgi:hypothetical protein